MRPATPAVNRVGFAPMPTESLRRAHDLAARLECGTVYVNTYRGVSPTSPAGGYKRSGLGRENGVEGLLEYLQVKSVWVGLDEERQWPFGSS